MATTIKVNGSTYPYPENGDTDWGVSATNAVKQIALNTTLDETRVVYVGLGGSDLNTSAPTAGKRFLTLNRATQFLETQLVNASNPWSIVIVGSGVYTETVSIPQYVTLYPNTANVTGCTFSGLGTVINLSNYETKSNKATTFTTKNDTLYPSVKASSDYITAEIPRDNIIINGNFEVRQRGDSFAKATQSIYTADRWKISANGGSSIGADITGLSPTDRPTDSVKYAFNVNVTGGASAGDYAYVAHYIEDVGKLAGKTVTLSFYIKSFTSSKSVSIEYRQNFGTGGSPSTEVTKIGLAKQAITTSLVKYSFTTTLPSISSKVLGTNYDSYTQIRIWLDAGSTYNANTNALGHQTAQFIICQVKLEEGSGVTAYKYEDYSDVLLKCQRYFYKLTGSGDSTTGYFYAAGTVNYVGGQFLVSSPVKMRIQPTMTTKGFYTTGTVSQFEIGTAMYGGNITSLPYLQSVFSSNDLFCIYIEFGFSGSGYYVFDYISSTHDGRDTEMSLSFDAEF